MNDVDSADMLAAIRMVVDAMTQGTRTLEMCTPDELEGYADIAMAGIMEKVNEVAGDADVAPIAINTLVVKGKVDSGMDFVEIICYNRDHYSYLVDLADSLVKTPPQKVVLLGLARAILEGELESIDRSTLVAGFFAREDEVPIPDAFEQSVYSVIMHAKERTRSPIPDDDVDFSEVCLELYHSLFEYQSAYIQALIRHASKGAADE